MSQAERRQRVFISYRRADGAGQAGRLADDLDRLLGDRVFMDVSDIAPGAEFEQVLRTELASCGAVLALIGPRWLASFDARSNEALDYVRLELETALAQQGLHVVPVLIGGAELPAETQMPAGLGPLAKRQAVILRDDRWQDDVANLARELRVVLKLRRRLWPGIAAAGLLAIVLSGWLLMNRTPAPTAFSREQADEISAKATQKAAAACRPAPAGSCPLVFRFQPDGTAQQVYFDSGSCMLKAPPFGDCMLDKLAAVRIPPFNDLDAAEVGLDLVVEEGGAARVVPQP